MENPKYKLHQDGVSKYGFSQIALFHNINDINLNVKFLTQNRQADVYLNSKDTASELINQSTYRVLIL